MNKKLLYILILLAAVTAIGWVTIWWLYGNVLNGTRIFVSADEDPSTTLGGQVGDIKDDVQISGIVLDAGATTVASGIIKIGAQEFTVTNGAFEGTATPGVYRVSFSVQDQKYDISPVTVQIVNAGQYNFTLGNAS